MKKKLFRIFELFSVFVVCLSIGYFLFQKKYSNNKIKTDYAESNVSQNSIEETAPKIVFDETPAYNGANFFEKLLIIEGEQAYIAYPTEIEITYPPTLIVYAHGSNTNVVPDFSDRFMLDLREYGEFFTKNGYAFAASNMHGANWGSDQAVNDMLNLINWVSSNYPINEKVNIIGYSMGGLPALNFSFKYPQFVMKIALLAPTTRVEKWGEKEVRALWNIDVKIWHGDKDVNVPVSLSKDFVQLCEKYDKTVDFEIVNGAGHFDIDTELKNEILEFFKK